MTKITMLKRNNYLSYVSFEVVSMLIGLKGGQVRSKGYLNVIQGSLSGQSSVDNNTHRKLSECYSNNNNNVLLC